MKISVVDDDFTALTLISDYLEDEGYEVVKASNPDELENIETFNAVIMDVMIGSDRTKGIRYILELAKKKSITPDKLVIFITNFGREKEEIKNLLDEVGEHIKFEFFDKSFDPAFYETLRETIERHQ
ncbi:MAG TPA: response regulator [Anaerolineales bacterium]|nr:response regulator [Anaerolineales bacterium]